MARSRSRSRSPATSHRRQAGGFKWKSESRGDDRRRRNKDGRYRDYDNTTEDSSRRRSEHDDRRYRDRRADRDRRDEPGQSEDTKTDLKDTSSNRPGVRDVFGDQRGPSAKAEDVPSKGGSQGAPAGEPMIIVHVNDRLGTKAAIPCLASDPIKLFKAQVAIHVGREPHEILLKRQGERPFKDQLTLEDYGISNGVQIDLEVDTGA